MGTIGRFGEYGGQYIPETLMNAVQELEAAYNQYKSDPAFIAELDDLMKNYAGRPSILYEAKKMSKKIINSIVYTLSLIKMKKNHFQK